MRLHFLVMIWAVLETLQDPEVSPRRISPKVLFSGMRQAVEIFLLLSVWGGILYGARHYFPEAGNFLMAGGVIIFYFGGSFLKRRETFSLMALAAATLLASGSLPFIFSRSIFVAAGVVGVKFIFHGIQKRQLLSPVPKCFSGMPGFLVSSALAILVLSAVFVR